jgi:hypothetical protein
MAAEYLGEAVGLPVSTFINNPTFNNSFTDRGMENPLSGRRPDFLTSV